MRSRELHDALRAFALEVAAVLSEAQIAGAELEFDLDEERARRGPTLYHYRPLTAKFISSRWPKLRSLPSCRLAAEALGAGAAAYLRAGGMRGGEAEPALQAMLERLYEDLTDFAFPEERFGRVYADLERTLFEQSRPATIVVAVLGLELEAERVDLGQGLSLERGERTDAPDEAVWGDPAGSPHDAGEAAPNALLTLTRDVTPDEPLPLADAAERFRRVLTGLRLWKAGGVALAAVAWRRSGEGRWQPFEIEASGVARDESWILVEGEDVELREFLDAIEGRVHGGATGWALARFEMGLGRSLAAEALSDYLLALRALLDGGVEAGRSSLALRVAVLCSEEPERRRTQRRVELAMALERFVMGNGAEKDYLDAIGSESPLTLVHEVERHLRALLRDLLCGYLDPDLRALADDLLLDQPDSEIRVRALRDGPATVAAKEPRDQEAASEGSVGSPDGVTAEIEAIEEEPVEVRLHESEPDWGDAASYSAPV